MALGNTLAILRPPGRSTPPIQTDWNEDLIKNMHKVMGEMAQQITTQVFGGLPAGASRPSGVKANVFWLDNTSATAPIVKLYDGADDITVMTFDYTANTVSWTGLLNIVNDTSPQLGGDLGLNGNVITGLEIGTDVQASDATLTSLAAVAGVAGDILFASGTDTWARLAKGTDGTVAVLASGLPSWGSPITRSSAIATTSGTAHGFTGIRAGANRISFNLDDVSLSGTDNLLIQIGDAGGYETDGYISGSANTNGTNVIRVISLAGFIVFVATEGRSSNGIITLNRQNGNTWVSSHSTEEDDSASFGGGTKTLSAELDRIQITRTGSDTYDLGSVSIFVE